MIVIQTSHAYRLGRILCNFNVISKQFVMSLQCIFHFSNFTLSHYIATQIEKRDKQFMRMQKLMMMKTVSRKSVWIQDKVDPASILQMTTSLDFNWLLQ